MVTVKRRLKQIGEMLSIEVRQMVVKNRSNRSDSSVGRKMYGIPGSVDLKCNDPGVDKAII
jgi:hypothetical protein